VWLANARIRRVREEATDEVVVVALNGCADSYASTLIEVARSAFHRPLLSLAAVGVLESRRALRQRIHRLLAFPPPRWSTVGWKVWLVIAALGFVLLPMTRGGAREVPPVNAPADAIPLSASDKSTNAADIIDSAEPAPGLVTRLFRVPPEILHERLLAAERGRQPVPVPAQPDSTAEASGAVAYQPASADPQTIQELLRNAIASQGVSLSPPSALYYNGLGSVMLRARASEMQRIQAWLEDLTRTPALVVIEARLLLLTADALQSPGLQWLAGHEHPTGMRGILTAPQAQVVRRVLQTQGEAVRSLDAPRITTVDGRRAIIEIGKWPLDLDRPLQPSALSLDVLPEVEEDGMTMKLHVVSQLTQAGKVTSAQVTPAFREGENPAERTVTFSVNAVGYITSNMTNAVRLYDGQTLLLNPRSDRGTGDDLVLMITPTIIDPAGNRVNKDDPTDIPAPSAPGQR
jgi:hypothetical protein